MSLFKPLFSNEKNWCMEYHKVRGASYFTMTVLCQRIYYKPQMFLLVSTYLPPKSLCLLLNSAVHQMKCLKVNNIKSKCLVWGGSLTHAEWYVFAHLDGLPSLDLLCCFKWVNKVMLYNFVQVGWLISVFLPGGGCQYFSSGLKCVGTEEHPGPDPLLLPLPHEPGEESCVTAVWEILQACFSAEIW